MSQPKHHNHDEPTSRMTETVESEGIMMPKTDSEGRIYREVRCANCRAFLCDEYIRLGRIRIKCFRCGRITIMEFRPYRSKRSGAPGNKKLMEDTHGQHP